MNIPYISLGARCPTARDTTRALSSVGGHLPFDDMISKWEGIIDCFQNNFKNFFPNKNEIGLRFIHHDFKKLKVIESLKRKIKRLDEVLKKNKRVVFVRDTYYDRITFSELRKLIDSEGVPIPINSSTKAICDSLKVFEVGEIDNYKVFKKAINKKYPKLNFRFIFVNRNINYKAGIFSKDDFFVANVWGDSPRKSTEKKYSNVRRISAVTPFNLVNFLKNNNIFTCKLPKLLN